MRPSDGVDEEEEDEVETDADVGREVEVVEDEVEGAVDAGRNVAVEACVGVDDDVAVVVGVDVVVVVVLFSGLLLVNRLPAPNFAKYELVTGVVDVDVDVGVV